MAKLTLAGCKHPILKPWGDAYPDGDFEVSHVTCMVCYERLIASKEDIQFQRSQLRNDNSRLKRDQPAELCEHMHKLPIAKDPKFTHDEYTDALCEDCGVVLRHPEGPGHWEEVIFNGYKIREEP